MRIDRVSKSYGATRVLHDISFDVEPGAYVCLLGPSGSGKSTLLRGIAGLTPIEGKVEIGGVDVTTLPPEKRELGMVFQSYAVWPHRTVFDNVAYPLQLRGADTSAVNDVLARVGLKDFGARMPASLSGGQQQRVALARALVMKPRALLLDEPLANLDPHLRADLCDQFRAINREQGLTFLHVTHDREEALGLATDLVVLDQGKLIEHGPPDALFHHPKSRFVAEFVAQGIRVGDEVYPRHALQIDPSGPLSATIESSAYAGTHWLVAVRFHNGALARIASPTALTAGDTLRLRSDVTWCILEERVVP